MIAVTRIRAPSVLKRLAKKWLLVLEKAKTEKARANALKKYNHPGIRKSLERMFSGKCAYCESTVSHNQHAAIEHYRPKSKWPKLTFEWSNLLLACGRCNGPQHKSNHFPETSGGRPLLLNPCDDDPQAHLRFDYNIQTLLASVYGTTQRGITTVRLLGLNRPKLRRHRSCHVAKLVCLAKLAPSDENAADLLRQATQRDSEYAAFALRLCPEPIAAVAERP